MDGKFGLSTMSTMLLLDEDDTVHPSDEDLERYVNSLTGCVSRDHRDEDAGTEAQVMGSLIMKCSEAIAAGDLKRAYNLVSVLRQQSAADGTAGERLAHCFGEALAARITGTGGMLGKALSSSYSASIDEFYNAYRKSAEATPHSGVPVFFTNQTILDHTGKAGLVHIIDFGIGHGFRWLCLLKDFSERAGGPPRVRITGVDFSLHHQGAKAGDVSAKLRSYARQVGVPLEYISVASERWDQITSLELGVQPGEFLVVTSFYRLRQLLDEAKKRLLSNIQSLKPKLFIHAIYPAGCNSPSFLSRMREAVRFYTGVFYSVEVSYSGDAPVRRLVESVVNLDVLNLVACEGEDRTERPESHRQWQALVQRAGFSQLPLRSDFVVKAEEMIRTYHESFSGERQGDWLFVRWRKYFISAMTAWTTL